MKPPSSNATPSPGDSIRIGKSAGLLALVSRLGPGVILSLTIAGAASFISTGSGGPVMLLALLIGIAFHFLASDERFVPGLDIMTRQVLRVGVALLGIRITVGDISGLGPQVVGIVICGVLGTITTGWLTGRALGLKSDHAVLSGGAVAICGASAALAISAVLPRSEQREANTILTVVGVTALSTIAMLVYPAVANLVGLDDREAGIFLGATIHDVAQVVGAGFAVSDPAGETATVVKLLRVALLAPAVFFIGLIFAREVPDPEEANRRGPLLPLFLVGFLALCLLNSTGTISPFVQSSLSDLSRALLIAAVAALGVKTSIKSLTSVGAKPMLCLAVTSLVLAAGVLAALLVL